MSVANLEAYALSKGITKSYNAMSQAEQVLLRYNYLLSVTTDAQGDFARTSGSFANQIRILQLNFDQLKIAMGNAIIPIAQAVLPGINAIIAALTRYAICCLCLLQCGAIRLLLHKQGSNYLPCPSSSARCTASSFQFHS